MMNFKPDSRPPGENTTQAPPAPPAPPAVQAENLTVVRGPRTVLRTLDFTVPRGQITGLLGPSGCGKSTLMRSIVGTQDKVTGTLDVLGRPAGHPALRTRIGYVTQAPSVYDDLTIRQNLALAIIQSALATGLAVWFLDLDVTGSPWLLLLVALLDALLGTALGLFVSAFAASEFQAVQFMPAVIFPQLLLCGLFAPRDTMHPALEAVSDVLPMSYAVDAMNEVLTHTDMTATFVRDVLIVGGCAFLVLCLGAATLRRRTA
ncbi:ABC transporter permease [Streptomyces sp. NPDC054950]